MWVSDRLSGKTAISVNDLDRIAEALGMEAADLLPRRAESDKRISDPSGQATPSRADARPPSRPRSVSTHPQGRGGKTSPPRTARIW